MHDIAYLSNHSIRSQSEELIKFKIEYTSVTSTWRDQAGKEMALHSGLDTSGSHYQAAVEPVIKQVYIHGANRNQKEKH